MSRRLHILTACSLTALYGVIGVWGGSLHYLMIEPGVSQPDSRNLATTIYYHQHDNAGHWHIHHHHAHPTSAPGKHSNARGRPHGDPDRAALTSVQPLRHSHSCALLTTISKLKLGHGSCPTRLARPGRSGVVPGAWEVLIHFQIDGHSLARGPPARTFPA